MVHGNIKARNVLLTRELDAAKLSTSGLAHLVGNGKRIGPCTAAGDIAALGTCLWLVRNPCRRWALAWLQHRSVHPAALLRMSR